MRQNGAPSPPVWVRITNGAFKTAVMGAHLVQLVQVGWGISAFVKSSQATSTYKEDWKPLNLIAFKFLQPYVSMNFLCYKDIPKIKNACWLKKEPRTKTKLSIKITYSIKGQWNNGQYFSVTNLYLFIHLIRDWITIETSPIQGWKSEGWVYLLIKHWNLKCGGVLMDTSCWSKVLWMSGNANIQSSILHLGLLLCLFFCPFFS